MAKEEEDRTAVRAPLRPKGCSFALLRKREREKEMGGEALMGSGKKKTRRLPPSLSYLATCTVECPFSSPVRVVVSRIYLDISDQRD